MSSFTLIYIVIILYIIIIVFFRRKKEKKQLSYSRWNNQWRSEFMLLKDNYDSDHVREFYEKILHIASSKISISAQREIYRQSYLFLSDKHKVVSLRFYIHYLNIKSESRDFKYKEISAVNKKRLFCNKQQEQEFLRIKTNFLYSGNLDDALAAVDDLYTVKRKKIVLDKSAILEAEAEHEEVVDLLNEILSGEEKQQEYKQQEKKYINEDNNQELLKLFIQNDYKLNNEEINIFVQTKNIFKGQLIDAINEKYFDIFDDILIEEAEDGFILNKNYYQQLP